MNVFLISLLTSFISGTVVLHKDRQTVEAHDTLPDGTKVDESIHYDPHHVNHIVHETQHLPGSHREAFVQKSFSAYGKDSPLVVKEAVGKLHPRVKALREEYKKFKAEHLRI